MNKNKDRSIAAQLLKFVGSGGKAAHRGCTSRGMTRETHIPSP